MAADSVIQQEKKKEAHVVVQTGNSPWTIEPDKDILVVFETNQCGHCMKLRQNFGLALNSPHNPFQTLWIKLIRENGTTKRLEWQFRDQPPVSEDSGDWKNWHSAGDIHMRGVPAMMLIPRYTASLHNATFKTLQSAITLSFDTGSDNITRIPQGWFVTCRIVSWMEALVRQPVRCGEDLESPLHYMVEFHAGNTSDWWLSNEHKIPCFDHIDGRFRTNLDIVISSKFQPKMYARRMLNLLTTSEKWHEIRRDRCLQVRALVLEALDTVLLRELVRMIVDRYLDWLIETVSLA